MDPVDPGVRRRVEHLTEQRSALGTGEHHDVADHQRGVRMVEGERAPVPRGGEQRSRLRLVRHAGCPRRGRTRTPSTAVTIEMTSAPRIVPRKPPTSR